MTQLPIVLFIGCALLTSSWLVPNHYWPWPAFHADALAAFGIGLLVVAALARPQSRPTWPLSALFMLAVACVAPLQAATGLVSFWGDAWMAWLYLLGFVLAVVASSSLLIHHDPSKVLCVYWTCVVSASVASAGIALYQWLQLPPVGVLMAELPPYSRPFGNLAQPNQLATVLILGAVGALALRQLRAIEAPVFLLTIGFLLFGAAMTRSRAAWIEIAFLVGWIFVMRSRALLLVPRSMAIGIGLAFAILVYAWPTICDVLYVSAGRNSVAQADGGTRPVHWASTLDAITGQPWFGYGWNQVSVAQMRVAIDHPFTGEMIEHSHNIVLDLLVWNGVPLGSLIVGACVWWFWKRATLCRNADFALLLLGIGVVCIHGLLEFPLEYAYVLLPFGFMVGAAEVLSRAARTYVIPKYLTALLAIVVAAMAAWVINDYVQLEENGRRLRFEAANIGPSFVEGETVDVRLLTQLRELYRLVRTRAQREMPPEKLEWMRKVTMRYPFSAALFRYATAAGLNRKPEVARESIMLLCKVHPRALCIGGRDAWAAMANDQYPELKAVPWPDIPPPAMPL